MTKISFSWDDGSIYDIKLANLMIKYDMKAMFFIPNTNWEQPYIKQKEIKELFDMGMEIGGHTVSHKYLTIIPKENIENEIKDNKSYLEDIIGNNVDIFCYPGGFYDEYIENIVKKYYKRARSAKTLRFNIQNSFTMDTTFHFYNRGVKSILKNTFQNDKKEFLTILKSVRFDTLEYYKQILLNLDKKKDYHIHIWGHGWEIEENNLWEELEDMLKFIKKNKFHVISSKEMYL